MTQHIFLGGTCGSNDWRKKIVIPALLAAGVAEDDIFDPVVEHWDIEAQMREDEAKRTASVKLFVIAKASSLYSTVEAIMHLYDDEPRTVVVFDGAEMDEHERSAITKSANELLIRFPNAPIFGDYEQAIGWIAAKYKK